MKNKKYYILKFTPKEWRKYQSIMSASIDMADLITKKCKEDLQIICASPCPHCASKSAMLKKELELARKWVSLSSSLQLYNQVNIVTEDPQTN